MAKKINGLTVAINADTSGVTAGLKDLTTQSISLSQQLRTVDKLLDMDPGNAEVIATKQKLLADSVDTTKRKLEALRAAQKDVQAQFERGDIGTKEYVAFQEELIRTENRLKDLGDTAEDTGEEMQDADEKSGKFGDTLGSVVSKGAKAAAAGIAAMSAAAAAAVGSIVGAADSAAEYGDNIDKMSQKLGMSAEAYQEWDFIMQHSGSDIDKMSTSMQKLADAVQEPTEKATDAFNKLGISLDDARKMSQEDLFSATITALQNMESGTERTALANDLLGKSAVDLGALLNMSAEETAAMRQEVHDLGGVMSDDAVETAAAYQDSLQNVKTAISGITRNIGSSFMPSMIQIMNATAQVASGNEDAIAGIEAGIDSFVDNLGDTAEKLAETADKMLPALIDGISRALPKLLQSGLKIVKTLSDAIIKNMPTLLNSAGQIILEMSRTLIRELPQLVKVGLQVITELAKGVVEALPELVPTIIDIVLEIVDILTDPGTLSGLIDASIAIILALTDGIISSLPELAERLPEIVDNIVTGIIDALPKLLDAAEELVKKLGEYLFDPENVDKMLTAGMDIITKLAKGIGDAIYKIGAKCKEIVKEIADKIGLGEYWEIGQQVIDEFMGGVVEKWNEWSSWWEGFGEYIYDMLHPGSDDGSMINEDDVWTPPEEPGAATGAYITRPTRLLTGEGGRREVILPLEQNTGWADILADKLAAAGGGGVQIQNITINAAAGTDGRRLANDFVAQLDTRLRQMQIQQVRGIGGTAW